MPSPVFAQIGMTLAFGLRHVDIFLAFFQIKVKIWHDIDLVDQDNIADRKH